jgi:hypothetical protein
LKVHCSTKIEGFNSNVSAALDKDEAWKSDPQVEAHIASAVTVALDKEAETTMPLFEVGRAGREAYLERKFGACHPGGKELTKLGHQAMNYGSPVADAVLYLISTLAGRTDCSTFLNIYDVDWSTIWRLRQCKSFEKMVGMRGTVKTWHAQDFYKTDFFQALPRKLESMFDKIDLCDAERYFDNAENKKKMQ